MGCLQDARRSVAQDQVRNDLERDSPVPFSEVSLAVHPETVTILTSMTTLSWSNMVSVIAAEALKLPLGLLDVVFMGYLGIPDPQSASRRLPTLLSMMESSGATEPLDFVCAFLGLLDPEDPVHGWLKPDYSKSVEGNNILGTGLPSWVPDWTSQGKRAGTWTYQQHFNRLSHAFQFNPSGGSALDISFPDPNVMHMRGTRFDRIADVGLMLKYIEHYGPEEDEATSTADMLLNHFRSCVLVLFKARRPYPTGQRLHEVFWRSCVGDKQFARHASDSLGEACRVWEVMAMRCLSVECTKGNRTAMEALEELRDVTQGLLGDEETGLGVLLQLVGLIISDSAVTEDQLLRTAMEWNAARMMCCAGRVLCVTEDGRVAICPPNTLVNDVVCIFHGVGTPFLLRQSLDPDSATMELVGEACLHGAMDGEGASYHEPEIFIVV
ncbi:hypothetical protein PpBr36_02699 [Pyricularia pennisetigena]|uniref:hypothetical protein n=1 Tax=Pyricularia pennisetigena TaxID=1578925 RepID=UPI0011523978|nr:hypothetical protein PpBr36_02699 [Pyricularia pennisetigena]TLS30478.1 hypothetical protein PpBr36_02699 [Pyricularia pennisetigena]